MPCRLALYLSIPSERNGGTPLPKPKNGTPPGSSAKLPKRSLTARRFQIPERSAFAVPDREALWASKPEVTASAAIPTTIEPMKPVRIWKLLLRRHSGPRARMPAKKEFPNANWFHWFDCGGDSGTCRHLRFAGPECFAVGYRKGGPLRNLEPARGERSLR